jgi:hypothetical protein
MGAQLVNGEGDFTISWSQIAEYRAKHLYHAHQTFAGRDYAFFCQPDSSSMRNLFLLPFSNGAWAALGLTFCLLLLVLVLSMSQMKTGQGEQRNVSFSEWLLSLISIIAQSGNSAIQSFVFKINSRNQGIGNFGDFAFVLGIWKLPTSFGPRLILISTFILSLVSYYAYNATLVASMSRIFTPITTFEELIKSGYMILTTPRVSLIYFYVSVSWTTTPPEFGVPFV